MDYESMINRLSAEVARLTAENKQAKEAIETLSAGRPLGDIVGLHTAQNALAEVERLKAELAEAKNLAEAWQNVIKLAGEREAELRAQEPVGYVREFEGDESDIGNMLFEADKNELDDNPHRQPVFARPVPAAQAVPVAWVRFCSDGGYEGPIMDAAMEEVRKRSGAWTPLGVISAAAQPPADQVPAATKMVGPGDDCRCPMCNRYDEPSEDAKDAARYRWLREKSDSLFVNISINGDGAEISSTLDAAIDAAMQKGGTK